MNGLMDQWIGGLWIGLGCILYCAAPGAGVLMAMKYLLFSLLLTSFVAATLGFGVLAGGAALVLRAIFTAAFVAFSALLAFARVHGKPRYRAH